MVKRKKKVLAPAKTAIFLNGRFVGTHPDGKSLANRLRERRRMNELSSQVNIYYDERLNELHILTDKGRVRRPYLVVENGKCRLTPEIMARIKNNELNWGHLVKMGIVEYLDAQEEENGLIAMNENELTPSCSMSTHTVTLSDFSNLLFFDSKQSVYESGLADSRRAKESDCIPTIQVIL